MAEDHTGPPEGEGAPTRRDRLEGIRRHVVDAGFARIEDMAERFSVSVMTIHRDLDELERQGWLRKVRGGATAEPSAEFHGDVRHRMQSMTEPKALIARAATDLVEPGASVILDESTTALAMAPMLPERAPLTVVTHFLPAIRSLAGRAGIDLVGLGGSYFPAYDAFFGMATVDAIRPLHADLLFMSTTAITGGACFHQSPETILVKRAMMESAERKVALIDHTKFEKQALHRLAPLTAFDLVIVDDGVPADRLAELAETGVAVKVAKPGEGDVVALPRG